jgi:phytoene synthase
MARNRNAASAGDGFAQAEAITQRYAKTFYFASRFLQRDKRYAAYAIYALCRTADDTVDLNPHCPDAQALREVERSLDRVYGAGEVSGGLLTAFKQTVDRYAIPRSCFDDLLEGMKMDLRKQRYENFEELYSYCYRVAGVVGLIMVRIFGFCRSEAERHAVELGVAMQLTNIVRDVHEDFIRGRIYLPLDEMERFGVSESQLAARIRDEQFKALIRFQITRARTYYASAARGIGLVDNFRCRLVVSMMKDLYAGILAAVERNDYDVFNHRAQVSASGKVIRAIACVVKGEYW